MTENQDGMKGKLRRIIVSEAERCAGRSGGKLSAERDTLKKKYLGYGYTVDDDRAQHNFSTYVDRCVLETIEWAKPSLFRVFSSGDEIIRYDPKSPEQEQAAADCTSYVNQQVFGRNMFTVIHDVLSDGLYQRVGWCIAQAPQRTERRTQQYTGLTQEEAQAVIMSAGVDPNDPGAVEAELVTPQEPGLQPTVNLTLHVEEGTRRIELSRIPSEQVIFSSDAADVETARFIAFWQVKTRSQLLMEGYSESELEGLQAYDTESDMPEAVTARTINAEHDPDDDAAETPENTRYQVYEAWFEADINKDGIAEKVHATYVGDAERCRVLSYEEWPMYRPPLFAACSVPMPHQLVGLCLADLVSDLQDLRTEMMRQYLDNLALGNQGELVVNEGSGGGSVDYDSLLARGPGAILRTSGDADIKALSIQTSATDALQGVTASDNILERRTGVTSRTQALKADTLQNTALGASIQEEAVNQRIELIARIYAEMFFRPLGRYVLNLLHRYQDKPLMARLKGRFMKLDPRGWDPDMEISVTVGLGTGDRSKMLNAYSRIIQLQQGFITQLGAASPVRLPHIIYSCHRLAEAAGLQAPERFFGTEQDAAKAEQKYLQQQAQAAQNTPEAQKAKAAQQKAQAEVQIKQQKAQNEMLIDQKKLQADATLEMARLQGNIRLKENEMMGEQILDQERMKMGQFDRSSRNLRQQIV